MHTPGPWHVQVTHTANGWTHQILGHRTGISSVVVADCPIGLRDLPSGPHATFDHQAENARLIAAAPDLLSVLKSLYGWLEETQTGGINYAEIEDALEWAHSIALAAISKAQGA